MHYKGIAFRLVLAFTLPLNCLKDEIWTSAKPTDWSIPEKSSSNKVLTQVGKGFFFFLVFSWPSLNMPTARHFTNRQAWQDFLLLLVISHSLDAGQLYSMLPGGRTLRKKILVIALQTMSAAIQYYSLSPLSCMLCLRKCWDHTANLTVQIKAEAETSWL